MEADGSNTRATTRSSRHQMLIRSLFARPWRRAPSKLLALANKPSSSLSSSSVAAGDVVGYRGYNGGNTNRSNNNDHGGIPVGAVVIDAVDVQPLRDQLELSFRRPPRGRKISLSLRAVELLASASEEGDDIGGREREGGEKKKKRLLVHLPTAAAAALDSAANDAANGDDDEASESSSKSGGKELFDFLEARGAAYLPGVRRPKTHRAATRKKRHARGSIAKAQAAEAGPRTRKDETGRRRVIQASTGSAASFTFTELFAGVGGFRLGLEALGGRCIAANEVDPYAASIYRNHFGSAPQLPRDNANNRHDRDDDDVMIEADILDVCAVTDMPSNADVLTAGFPCQPFSSRGAQPGLSDERDGQLYREVIRMLRGTGPKSFVLENVMGLVTLGGGGCGGRSRWKERGEAGSVLNHMLEEFEGCGYTISWNVCNGRHWGAQNRERVFIVGVRSDLECSRKFCWDWYAKLRGWDWNENNDRDKLVTAEISAASCPSVVRDILEPPDAPSVRECMLTPGQWDKVRSLHNFDTNPMGIGRARINLDAKAPTLISSYRRIGNLTSKYIFDERDGTTFDEHSDRRPRFLSPRECCRIMGFPEDFHVPSVAVDGDDIVGHFYAGIGNAVIPPVVTAIGKELMNVLDSAAASSSSNDLNGKT